LAREGPLPPARALPLMAELLDALGAAHSAGVMHRDLKPSNIFLVRRPEGGVNVKLLDFGLAKTGREGASSGRTKASVVAGTPQYISPEQAKGLAPTRRSDLYSFGVVLFEVLTGRLPFGGHSWAELVYAHAKLEAPTVSSLLPGVPAALDTLVAELLHKDAQKRPAGAGLVKERLEDARHALHLEPTLPLGSPLREEVAPPSALADSVQRTFGVELRWVLVGLGALAALGAGLIFELARTPEPAFHPPSPVAIVPTPTPIPGPSQAVPRPEPIAEPKMDADFEAKMKAAIAREQPSAKVRTQAVRVNVVRGSSAEAPNPPVKPIPPTDKRCGDETWKQDAKSRVHNKLNAKIRRIPPSEPSADEERANLKIAAGALDEAIDDDQTFKDCIKALMHVDEYVKP
jgi:serine/threonine-protein kinase